jgi:hypothetical protein
MRRKTRINPRRLRPRRGDDVDRDLEYLAQVRKLPCLIQPCYSRKRDPHHAGEHAKGKKAPDITAIPLCRQHHDQWHLRRGFCEGWDNARRRQWQDEMIERTQRLLGRKAA